MSDTRKIRWGVLGYARIAREQVMPAIRRSGNSVLSALASRDEAKLTDARSRFGELQLHRSYDDLLQDSAVDAVYIPLPNSLHREWTLKAVAAKKHVLCEKPVGLNAEESAEMIAAARQHGVKLMEAFMYRYTDRTRQVLDIVRSGALGELQFITSEFRFLLSNPASIKLRPELGGGSLYDVGCYPVNFVGMVLDSVSGSRPGSVLPSSVSGECLRSGGVDMNFAGVLKYPSGLIASIACGFNAHGRMASHVIGTKGVLEIPDTFLNDPGKLTLIAGTERREFPVVESDRYRAEVEDFAGAILEGRDPLFSLEETQRNATVIDRLIAAAG